MATIEQRVQELERLVGFWSGRVEALFGETATLVPVGAILAYSGVTAPVGWLVCDGSTIRKDTFAALAALLGTRFGAAPEGFVRLPNLNGRVAVGAGRAAESGRKRETGEAFGVESLSLTVEHLPPHQHALSPTVYQFRGSAARFLDNENNAVVAAFPYVPNHGPDPEEVVRQGRATKVVATTAGSGRAVEINPPSLAVTYIVKH